MGKEIKDSGYVFVLTLIDPQFDTPYEVIPNHFLQKATADQIESIKSLLHIFDSNPHLSRAHYEYDVIETQGDQPGSRSFDYKELPADKLRYWVINFQGFNAELQELGYALGLMDQDIDLGFYFITSGSFAEGYGWHAQSLHTYFNDDDRRTIKPKKISSSDIKLAGECYLKIKELSKKYPHIKRAFFRLNTLNSILLSSDLTTIGLFSIIECLLTHAPNDNDPTDSLGRQIRHKIPLVSKRFKRTIDHTAIFQDISEDNLWKKLYSFRSKIVHGDSAIISGKLKTLKDLKTVVKFLREVVKLLLIQSLDEPVLMTDW